MFTTVFVAINIGKIVIAVEMTVLTLNTLNDFNINTDIFAFRILDSVQQKKTELTTQQPYLSPIPYIQYHFRLWPGILLSQGISRHGIGQIRRSIPLLASEEWITIRFKLSDGTNWCTLF